MCLEPRPLNTTSDFQITPNPGGDLNQFQLLLAPRSVWFELVVTGTGLTSLNVSMDGGVGGTITLEASNINTSANQCVKSGIIDFTVNNPLIDIACTGTTVTLTQLRVFGINSGLRLAKKEKEEDAKMKELLKRLENLEILMANETDLESEFVNEYKVRKPKQLSGTASPKLKP